MGEELVEAKREVLRAGPRIAGGRGRHRYCRSLATRRLGRPGCPQNLHRHESNITRGAHRVVPSAYATWSFGSVARTARWPRELSP